MLGVAVEVAVLGDADQLPIPNRGIRRGVVGLHPTGIVPPSPVGSDLVILRRVEAHVGDVVLVQRVPHQAGVVGVGLQIQPPRMSEVEVVPDLVHRHGGVHEVIPLVHRQPAIDVRVRRPAAVLLAPSLHEQDVPERPGQLDAELLLRGALHRLPYVRSRVVQRHRYLDVEHARRAEPAPVALVDRDVEIPVAAARELRRHRLRVPRGAEELVRHDGGVVRQRPALALGGHAHREHRSGARVPEERPPPAPPEDVGIGANVHVAGR